MVENHWSRSGVPRRVRRRNAEQLEAQLVEAVEDGRSIDDVVGSDAPAFAAEWASVERRHPIVDLALKTVGAPALLIGALPGTGEPGPAHPRSAGADRRARQVRRARQPRSPARPRVASHPYRASSPLREASGSARTRRARTLRDRARSRVLRHTEQRLRHHGPPPPPQARSWWREARASVSPRGSSTGKESSDLGGARRVDS